MNRREKLAKYYFIKNLTPGLDDIIEYIDAIENEHNKRKKVLDYIHKELKNRVDKINGKKKGAIADAEWTFIRLEKIISNYKFEDIISNYNEEWKTLKEKNK